MQLDIFSCIFTSTWRWKESRSMKNLTVEQFIEELKKVPQGVLVTLPYGENGNSIGISGLATDDDVVEIVYGSEV